MSRKSAIVFGGGGFIGTNLCRRLISSGYAVRGFGHSRLFPDALAGVEWVSGDLADTAAVARALEGAAIVFHLIHSTLPHAASQSATETHRHIGPTLSLLDECRTAGVARVVFVSSGGTVYGNAARIPTAETEPSAPITPYAVSNVAIEQNLALRHQRDGLDYRVLRAANPYGPFQTANRKQGVIATMIKRALQGDKVDIWGDGSVVRDFVYIDDVVDALLLAAETDSHHRIFNIGSGRGRSLLEVIAAIEDALQRPLEINWLPGRPSDVPVSVVAIGRAREALGWEPKVGFGEGLRGTISWWRKFNNFNVSI
jgi:UDP-glucose 4-epimerase